jgi:hypothetical protein
METSPFPQWLAWARELQAMSQTGLAFTLSPYDTQRYTRLAELAAAIVATHVDLPAETVAAQFLAQPGYATPIAKSRTIELGRSESENRNVRRTLEPLQAKYASTRVRQPLPSPHACGRQLAATRP